MSRPFSSAIFDLSFMSFWTTRQQGVEEESETYIALIIKYIFQ